MIIILESIGNHFNRGDNLFMTRNILHTYFGALESYIYYYYYYYYYYYFIFTQYYEFGQIIFNMS